MNSLNSLLIEGNLVREPEFRTTAKGTSLCNFSIVANRYYKTENGMEKEVSYFNVQTWAKLAENCKEQGRKGRGVRIVGRIRQERWNDSDGKAHEKVVIVAEHVEFRAETAKAVQEAEAEPDGGEAGERLAACF